MGISWKRGALVSAGIVCTTVIVAAPPASAIDWDHRVYTNDSDPGGVVYFEEHGDIVRVCDIEADGYAVRVETHHIGRTRWGYTLQRGGVGNCRQVDANYYNLPENEYIDFEITLVKDGREGYRNWGSWYNDH